MKSYIYIMEKANTNYARLRGNLAAANNKSNAAALDTEFMKTLKGRKIGDKKTISELKAWNEGYHEIKSKNTNRLGF